MAAEDNPWSRGHSIEILREVASAITADVSGFEAIADSAYGVTTEWVIAHGVPEGAPVVLYFHGGAYLCGSPVQYRNMTVWLSRRARVRVLSVDYRLAPEHPYPAAFEDGLAAYQWLLAQPAIRAGQVAIAGDSAGAGLAVTLAADIVAADLPIPACVLGNSPYADLALASPSLNDPARNQHEPNKTTIQWLAQTYLQAGHVAVDARDPRHSPVYRNLTGLPPLLIQTGDLDNLQDDGARLAARAAACGVDVRYTTYREAPHIWPVLTPADQNANAAAAIDEMAAFIGENINGRPSGRWVD